MVFASLARRLGHRSWFARMGRFLVPADRLVGRLTRGRIVALGLLPSLMLTTTGRRSGRPRMTPLAYVADGDGYAIIASNWGQPHHPAWSGNLLANPAATVEVGGRRIPVRATLVDGAERERLRALLVRAWPAYVTYEHRAAHRRLRIFRLAPSREPD
jgi:deazaflavin-dependent oxidoreductase (nitroreductase family)